LNYKTARDISIGLGLAIGLTILLETMINAVSLAPSFGEAVPSWLAWANNVPLIDSLWIDSLVSITIIAWFVFQLVERKTLEGPSRRLRRGQRGNAAVTVLILVVAVVLLGAAAYALFGLTAGQLVSNFEHFLGGL
jgi:hypothetical protein